MSLAISYRWFGWWLLKSHVIKSLDKYLIIFVGAGIFISISSQKSFVFNSISGRISHMPCVLVPACRLKEKKWNVLLILVFFGGPSIQIPFFVMIQLFNLALIEMLFSDRSRKFRISIPTQRYFALYVVNCHIPIWRAKNVAIHPNNCERKKNCRIELAHSFISLWLLLCISICEQTM